MQTAAGVSFPCTSHTIGVSFFCKCSSPPHECFGTARLNILFTSTNISSFISEDLTILGKHFTVDHVITSRLRTLWKIPVRVVKADVTYTWFASVHAFVVLMLARVFRKKSVIVIGGSDVAYYPEIGYGIWISRWRAPLVKYALRHADRILSVDPYISSEAKRLAQYDGRNIEYVPTGYDPNLWTPEGTKEPFVLNVSACDTEARLKQKGLDVLIRAARLLPDTAFVIVGLSGAALQILRREAPKNVELQPYRDRLHLLSYYRRAKVYCQPSLFDGLPNSLCEAMLCECIPVGANAGGIPTAIRNPEFLVPYGDAEALAAAITKALSASHEVGKASRRYIAETFPLTRRENALVQILEDMVG
jgi:glycosyltransferase involved in cell wall biosynthesis